MAGVDLADLAPGVRYAKAPTSIGVVANGRRAALVDTGLDDNLVRKVLNALRDEGLSLEAIVNTHAHADHIGGNAFALARAPGAEVVAPAGEAAFVERPALEPHTLYGAEPPTGLETKWLRAAPSRVARAIPVADGPAGFEAIGLAWRYHPLRGHSPDQCAVEVAGACFLGDALLPAATLEKYGVAFAVDPGPQRASAERAPTLGPFAFHTYHGGAVDDARALAAANVAAVDRAQGVVLAAVGAGGRSTEDVFESVAEAYGWTLSLEQYHLNLATIRAHLARLERNGAIAPEVRGGRLVWNRKS